tara:strand:+ start:662 stop:1084 length:423 start_codon:yes stop_codon:yes gene_type:complete
MSMEKIYSKLETDKLLHVVHRIENAADVSRNDLIESNNFIQCSLLKLKKNSTFRPHKHIFKKRKYENQIAQESWVVIKGSVKCIFYDLDDSVITETILHEGDASFTLLGGHNYISLEDNTVVYEYKTGPYEGQKHDKIFI